MTPVRCAVAAECVALAACAGSGPVPAWKTDAEAALERFQRHYLAGDTALADRAFAEARLRLSATGDPALGARADLIRCATASAALDFSACDILETARPRASGEERAYADFLAGRWVPLDAAALPEQYRAVVRSGSAKERLSALGAIGNPLSRAIAAAVLFRQAALPPEGVRIAVDTASAQGWRRPLLAWLSVEEKQLIAAGDAEGAARVRARIEFAAGGR